MTPAHQRARAVVDEFQLFIMHNSDSAIIADDDDVLTEYIATALVEEIESCAQAVEGVFSKAHTRASENADIYDAQDDAIERAASAVRQRNVRQRKGAR